MLIDVLKSCSPHGSTEVEKNKSLARILTKAGYLCQEHSLGLDIVGQSFVVECKITTKTSDIDRFVGQMDRYVSLVKGRALFVVVYGDVSSLSERRIRQRLFELFGLNITYDVIVKSMVVVKEKELDGKSYSDVYHKKRNEKLKKSATVKSVQNETWSIF